MFQCLVFLYAFNLKENAIKLKIMENLSKKNRLKYSQPQNIQKRFFFQKEEFCQVQPVLLINS